LLVVGSIGYDTIYGPIESGTSLLGGSATYCSIAASNLTNVAILAVVGSDFKPEHFTTFKEHGINIDGIEQTFNEETFAWSVRYNNDDINSRETLDTQLNALATFNPQIKDVHQKEKILFLANMDPVLQIQVIKDMGTRPQWIGLDTMNFWIDSTQETLTEAIRMVDIVFMDEGELRSYAQSNNVIVAAQKILKLGPSFVVAKRGEHGVILINEELAFAVPAFPLTTVVDPTGAGDSFAGGFMGFLDSQNDISTAVFKRAIITGSIMGSFAVGALGTEGISHVTYDNFNKRFNDFSILTQFDPLEPDETFPWK
jgi:sugar/nucleoside kinase (ribokinase family)